LPEANVPTVEMKNYFFVNWLKPAGKTELDIY